MNPQHSDSDLSIKEVMEFTGMTRKQIEGFIRRNKFYSYLDEEGHRRVPWTEIENFGSNDQESFDYTEYDPKHDIPKSELWGHGKAPIIQLPRNKDWITIMGVSDIHYPWHNAMLIDASIEVAKHIDPDLFVFNGDLNDFFAISRFNTANERLDVLGSEIEGGKQIRRAYVEAIPNAQFHDVLGNHEERILTYPAFRAPALRSLDVMKPSKLLGLDDLGIKHWPMNGFRVREDFLIEHGATVRSGSGATAKARLDATLISGIMGHTHRLSEYRRTGYRDLVWYEGGSLCMLNPDYVKAEANWKSGFWIATFSTKTKNHSVQLVPSVGQGFIFDGKHFGQTTTEQDLWSGPKPDFNGLGHDGSTPLKSGDHLLSNRQLVNA